MVRVVEDQFGRLEADTVLSLVDLILSFIPGKFRGSLCIDDYVYTIARLSIARRHPPLAKNARSGTLPGAVMISVMIWGCGLMAKCAKLSAQKP